MKYLPLVALASAALLVGGCKRSAPIPAAPDDPVNFLKWSMDRYAEMPDMQAGAEVVTSMGKKASGDQLRTFRYQSPNKFRVESKGDDGVQVICVSDGSQEADYDNKNQASSSVNIAAPASISGASTADMIDPSLCGSLIYYFFGGSANYTKLVHGPVNIVSETTSPDGEPVRIVSFNTPGLIGDVKAAIGKKTGYVYMLSYDFGGAKAKIEQRLTDIKAEAAKADPHTTGKVVDDQVDKLLKTKFTEMYSNIRVGMQLSRGSFDPAMPGPAALAALGIQKPNGDGSPIPLDQPAPDVSVKTLDGKTVALSQLRGHPVMIDFWATWCGPCRQGLPETAKITHEGAKAGLVVLAVSNEDTATIQGFLKQQSYKLNAYQDEGNAAEKAFMVNAWPTQVFIDAKGNLQGYVVGYEAGRTSSQVQLALKKAGFKPTG